MCTRQEVKAASSCVGRTRTDTAPILASPRPRSRPDSLHSSGLATRRHARHTNQGKDEALRSPDFSSQQSLVNHEAPNWV